MTIAVSIITHNRYEIFKKSYTEIKKRLPKNALLIVIDDGSTIPVTEADFRFEKSQGIAAAKNKAFELSQGYDYHFAFDDDIFPLVDDWHLPYINSGENHLCFTFTKFSNGQPNGRKQIGEYKDLNVFYEPCGCMNFYTKACFDKVGGMDVGYGKWSYEHVSHSMRIHNAGLTPHPFMDVKNSLDLFYSYDWDQTTKRSVDVKLRNKLAWINKKKYFKEKNESNYISFMQKENILLTCYFTGVSDPQRGEAWKADISQVDELINSLQGVKLVILHDCFDFDEYRGAKLVRVETSRNPYFQRWFSYMEFIESCDNLDKVFCIDATDVQLQLYPFDDMEKSRIYVGDEESTIDNVWLKRHHNVSVFKDFYRVYRKRKLLNAGIVGGHKDIVIRFLKDLTSFYNKHDGVLGDTDMAALNYILHTVYPNTVTHGTIVNTVFKAFEQNEISWFRHK